MKTLIHPGIARGIVQAPPSKSMAHRRLICAALAEGESVISLVDRSEDILATADCLEALGASLSWKGNSVRVRGCDPRKAPSAVLRCRESGSTLRFMIPLCLLSGNKMYLEGSETLLSRPLTVYEDLCRTRGMTLERRQEQTGGSRHSLLVQGTLSPGDYSISGSVSSQFITGLLFTLPLLPASSRILLIPPVESRSYLNLTLQALRDAGVLIRQPDENTLDIPGGTRYIPQDAAVEGDYSNAAFPDALNMLGGNVTVSGLRETSLQGDRIYRDYFSRLKTGKPELDLSDCPDLAPVLFVLAACLHGAVFTGTRRLRFKESDRGAVMAEELAKFSVPLQLGENRIVVPGGCVRSPSEPLSSHNDHRIAMALSLLCTCTGGEILGAEAVRKSWPGWWECLRSLGIDVQEQQAEQQDSQ